MAKIENINSEVLQHLAAAEHKFCSLFISANTYRVFGTLSITNNDPLALSMMLLVHNAKGEPTCAGPQFTINDIRCIYPQTDTPDSKCFLHICLKG